MATNLEKDVGNSSQALAEQLSELRAIVQIRLDELRSREALDASAQIADLERQLMTRAAPPKGPNLDTVLKLTSAIMPILLLVIGYFLIDTVKFAFEERRIQVQEGQLDLAAVEGMRDLLKALRAKNVDEDVARVNALLVAGYGVHGIAPLIMDLDLSVGDRRRADAAVGALKSYLLSEYRAEVCKRLRHVITIPRFSELGLERTVKLIGYLNCQEAVSDLGRIEKSEAGDNLKQAARDARELLTGTPQ